MKPGARVTYHKTLWPAVCKAQKLNPKDDALRRDVVRACLDLAGAPPITTSDPAWQDAHTTALFTYLRHLAEPNNIELVQRWTDCKQDYVAYHTAKVADYWQEKAYGKRGGGKLTRNRFGNRERAHQGAFDPAETLTRKEAQDRLHTMRERARSKTTEAPF